MCGVAQPTAACGCCDKCLAGADLWTLCKSWSLDKLPWFVLAQLLLGRQLIGWDEVEALSCWLTQSWQQQPSPSLWLIPSLCQRGHLPCLCLHHSSQYTALNKERRGGEGRHEDVVCGWTIARSMPGPSGWFILAQWGRGPSVKEEDSTFPLTNELQRQDTVWHRPLDVVVTGGCVVIPSKKVGLGEGVFTIVHPFPFPCCPPLPHPLGGLWPSSHNLPLSLPSLCHHA